jgi:O-antigen/teichoic acid export membrane protein
MDDPAEERDRKTADLSLGRESAVAFAAKLALTAVGFLGFVFFGKTLGPTGIGLYYFVLATAKFTVQGVGGVSNAIKKRVAEAQTDVGPYFGLGLLLVVGFTGLLFAGIYALEGVIVARFGPVRYAYGGAAIVGSLGLFSLTNRVYAGVGRPGASFWVDTLRSVLTLGGQVALLTLGFGAMGLIGGLVGATVVCGVLAGVLVGVRPRLPTRAVVGRTVEFARWSVPNALVGNLYGRIDVIILGVVVGSTVVGFYEAALRVTMPATLIAIGIGDSLVVKASGLSSLGEDVERDLRNAMSYAGVIALPLFAGALALPPESLLVYLLREDFGPAWPAVVGLALFQVFNVYGKPFGSVLNGMDRPDIQFRVSLLTVAVHLPLVVAFVHWYGLIGVVVATVIAEAVRLATYQVVARSVFGRVVLTRPMAEQAASAAVMFVVVKTAATVVVPVAGWVELAGLLALGGGTYFGLLLAVSGHFRTTLRSVAADTVAPRFG